MSRALHLIPTVGQSQPLQNVITLMHHLKWLRHSSSRKRHEGPNHCTQTWLSHPYLTTPRITCTIFYEFIQQRLQQMLIINGLKEKTSTKQLAYRRWMWDDRSAFRAFHTRDDANFQSVSVRIGSSISKCVMASLYFPCLRPIRGSLTTTSPRQHMQSSLVAHQKPDWFLERNNTQLGTLVPRALWQTKRQPS